MPPPPAMPLPPTVGPKTEDQAHCVPSRPVGLAAGIGGDARPRVRVVVFVGDHVGALINAVQAPLAAGGGPMRGSVNPGGKGPSWVRAGPLDLK